MFQEDGICTQNLTSGTSHPAPCCRERPIGTWRQPGARAALQAPAPRSDRPRPPDFPPRAQLCATRLPPPATTDVKITHSFSIPTPRVATGPHGPSHALHHSPAARLADLPASPQLSSSVGKRWETMEGNCVTPRQTPRQMRTAEAGRTSGDHLVPPAAARGPRPSDTGTSQAESERPAAALPVHTGCSIPGHSLLPLKLHFWICAVSHLSSTKQNASGLSLVEYSL